MMGVLIYRLWAALYVHELIGINYVARSLAAGDGHEHAKKCIHWTGVREFAAVRHVKTLW